MLRGQISAIVQLIKGELREVVGVQDWETIVRDVAVDFGVGKEEGTHVGLRAVEVLEDLLGVGDGGDVVVVDFDEPCTAKVGSPAGYA